ncbi:MAG: hypothetical protein JWN56_2279 [Sphingobacteriales bacterium]|nr:hypothetical protein [Sphingobacteriales bacterium]
MKVEEPLKVLLISYDFYPDTTPNTFRWFNVLKAWSAEGIQVFVLSNRKLGTAKYEEINGIKIYRTNEWFIGSLKHHFKKKSTTKVPQQKKTVSSISFTTIIRSIYDRTWAKVYWPDFAVLWYFSTLSQARRIIKNEGINKIITVSWPFTGHLIGFKLKKEFPNVFWLADTIDPFCYHDAVNNKKLYAKLNILMEKKVFGRADSLSVLTDKIKDKYISYFPEVEKKMHVNNNLFIPTKFNFNKVPEGSCKFRLVFLGSLIENVRTPKNLLFLFNRLITEKINHQLELHFYGDINSNPNDFNEYSHEIGKSIFLHGKINRDKVNDVIRDADALINIGNDNEFQEPSKVIEYMYSGKHIINICSIMNDTSASLLKNYPLKINIYPNNLLEATVVEEVFRFLSNKEEINSKQLQLLLNDYFLETVKDKYLTYLQN